MSEPTTDFEHRVAEITNQLFDALSEDAEEAADDHAINIAALADTVGVFCLMRAAFSDADPAGADERLDRLIDYVAARARAAARSDPKPPPDNLPLPKPDER